MPVPFATVKFADTPSLPFRPIEPSLPFNTTPLPSAPFTPITPSLPSFPTVIFVNVTLSAVAIS
ncbi:hypothetical protein E4T80_05235 [Muribacter muris]|uniref:Uncharacterized protein n=1 Tax=Muribacter muris TaxID=67855 RepID=A0A4Y9K1G7_9PAST|nr:hypothetical protein E4T80_05235 [Muribacter muris]